jgi:hypothetical protein
LLRGLRRFRPFLLGSGGWVCSVVAGWNCDSGIGFSRANADRVDKKRERPKADSFHSFNPPRHVAEIAVALPSIPHGMCLARTELLKYGECFFAHLGKVRPIALLDETRPQVTLPSTEMLSLVADRLEVGHAIVLPVYVRAAGRYVLGLLQSTGDPRATAAYLC